MTTRNQNYANQSVSRGTALLIENILSLPVQKLDALEASQVLRTSMISFSFFPYTIPLHYPPKLVNLAHPSEWIGTCPDFALLRMKVKHSSSLLDR